jgi:ABC-type dipeptide/oligopeptide/nickel transport system permease component
MIGYILKRFLGTLPVVVLIALGVFMLLQAAPGDPAEMLISDQASPAEVAAAKERWGLGQPVFIQFLRFASSAIQLDFGRSFKYDEPVLTLIGERFPATLELALFASLLAIILAVPLGMWAARHPNSWIDTLSSTVGFVGISMPNFWLGIVLILVVSGYFGLLPSNGRETLGVGASPITGFAVLDALLAGDVRALIDALRHMVLPVFVLSLNMVGIVMRVTRSSMLDALGEDYIMTARAKGLTERVVCWRHGLPNALVTVVTVVGFEFGVLLSGSIIVEAVFAWPGIGNLLLQGIGARDYPLITGVVLVYTSLFLVVNLLMDFIYAAIDPRIRLDG